MSGATWMDPPADYIGTEVRTHEAGGLVSTNPANPSETVWSGAEVIGHVEYAVGEARAALSDWARTDIESRAAVLRRYQQLCKDRAEDIAQAICAETGKAIWDSRAEAGAVAAKVDITLEEGEGSGRARVATHQFGVTDSRSGRFVYRPHGVMAVVGPFNFPAHLPNGHIVPALLMGNTVVLKPSEKTPGVGQMIGRLFREALQAEGFSPSIVNVVHGGAEPAKRLTTHEGVDGILFTGSWGVGRRILEANLDNPGRIVALEMGGNNPAVVMDDASLAQAVTEVGRAAWITSGQRCTCTRRIIVHDSIYDRFVPALTELGRCLEVGDPLREPHVFMGPVISAEARDAAVGFARSIADAGGRTLLSAEGVDPDARGGHYVSPGLIEVDSFVPDERDHAGCDLEVFGPIARISRVGSLDEAIEQANATRYGLASSIFTRNTESIERFLIESRAGCVNANCGTAGASSKSPFGGLGLSGNHRPAGSSSLDYCAYPVASLIESGDAEAKVPGMSFDRQWLEGRD